MYRIFSDENLNELKKTPRFETAKKVFLVRGKTSFVSTGAEHFIRNTFNGKEIFHFFDFDVNPKLTDLEKGIELFKKDNFDIIVGIGGGSVLDMAKLISVFSNQKSNTKDLIKGIETIEPVKTPLLAIPTTAGTGAEATHFSVIYIDKKKYSVAHPLILPDYIFLSPAFTYSANGYLTACTGLDAFCQAIESVWNVNATVESQNYALDAIKTIWENLPAAVNNNDKKAKDKMLYASFNAGRAINITKTTAPHAVSYAFTSYYGIPHGHAVALSLAYFFKYNYNVSETDCNDPRGPEAVRKKIDKILRILNTDINGIDNVLNGFFKETGIETNIGKLIKNLDRSLIINNINTERLKNNPRYVTKQTLENFLK